MTRSQRRQNPAYREAEAVRQVFIDGFREGQGDPYFAPADEDEIIRKADAYLAGEGYEPVSEDFT